VAGSLSVFFGGWGLTAIILFIYVSLGIFSGPFSRYLIPIALVALAGTVIESLPQKDVDNITLTVTAVLVGWFVF
jgi:phytol kinase